MRWGLIGWATRTLFLDEKSNRPRGGRRSAPKSGRVREVVISNQLLTALADLYATRFKPSPEELVLKGIDPWNFRKRAWRRIIEGAGIGHRSIKDLHDTYASQLLTAGIQLGYISVQLGHADHNVTARHYARWIPKEYVEPMRLLPGEVPADLLARLSSRQIRQTTSNLSTRAAEQVRQLIERTLESGDPGAIRTRDPQLRRSEAIPGNSVR